MVDVAKTLIFFGLLIFCVGVVLLFLSKTGWVGRLPGDIFIRKENFTFYFPLATCLIISLVLSFLMFFLNKR